MDSINIVFKTCLEMKPNERVCIIYSPEKRDIADLFYSASTVYSNRVQKFEITSMTENGQEPTENIATAMRQTDIAILLTSYSLSHTNARIAASNTGARIISMPGITLDMLNRAVPVNYDAMARDSERLAEILSQGSRVHITSPAGTDVTLDIHGRIAYADTGIANKPGDFINLPAGEAFIAPIEHATNGRIVFDGAIANISLDKPVILDVKNGHVEAMHGATAALAFGQAITAAGKNADIVCELGIGTNPKAVASPEILEAEKVMGTCHIAFGKNDSFGGINSVAFHSDGLIKRPTLTVDGNTVLKEGSLCQ